MDTGLEVTGSYIKEHFPEGSLIDKGDVLVENEHDMELLMKYIEALRVGNDMYRPEGLKQYKEQ